MAKIDERFSYDGLVVVAENEWYLHLERDNDDGVDLITYFGGYEWECGFHYDGSWENNVRIECLELAALNNVQVHVEVLIHDCWGENENLEILTKSRKYLTKDDAKWKFESDDLNSQKVLLTIRLLEERDKFPNFTSGEDWKSMAPNVHLMVGQQKFHVNKEILSCYSAYFNKMFSGNFVENTKNCIELKQPEMGDPDPVTFHDFLLLMTMPGNKDVLPNSMNVAKLLEMAEYYDSPWVRDKCEQQLVMCREISETERLDMAKQYGLLKLKAKLSD